MAVTHVQYLGGIYSGASAHTTTVIAPSSKTVTAGGLIVVGFLSYANVVPSGVADNLGNTYAHIENKGANNMYTDSWYAPVTKAGSITAITVTHASSAYTMAVASEFAGAGTLNGVGEATTGSGTTLTGVANKTIPANGFAVWVAGVNSQLTINAGAASGSPSTSISKSGSLDGGSGTFTLGIFYALAGTSSVTAFTGTTTWTGTQYWAGAGGLFDPAAAVKPNFIPFFWP
jgi:hypothetical protein